MRLDRLAAGAGYRTVAAVTTAGELEARAALGALAAEGPHFVLIKVTREEAEAPRIPYSPAALRDRFRAAVLGG